MYEEYAGMTFEGGALESAMDYVNQLEEDGNAEMEKLQDQGEEPPGAEGWIGIKWMYSLIHFRRGLKGAALVWYQSQDDETKQDWCEIASRFQKRFPEPSDRALSEADSSASSRIVGGGKCECAQDAGRSPESNREKRITSSTEELRAESLAAWAQNAAYWDDAVGRDGNIYWKWLQEPSLRRLVFGAGGVGPGFKALDLCSGNGLVARWLADPGHGARAGQITATDGCVAMLERALSRWRAQKDAWEEGPDRPPPPPLPFRSLDVCDARALVFEGTHGPYDLVTMNMAIMDVPTLEPLAEALAFGGLLRRGGIFVATLLHPVFFTSNAAKNLELKFDEATGDLQVVRTKIIRDYLFVPPMKGIALPGQPVKQPYFHRPLHEVFRPFFAAGLVMDAMEEPAFTEEDHDPNRIEASRNYTQLPAILSFRMRRP
ncbi:hypothetical protein RB594_004105 [Gaeumannomyces avenae]